MVVHVTVLIYYVVRLSVIDQITFFRHIITSDIEVYMHTTRAARSWDSHLRQNQGPVGT